MKPTNSKNQLKITFPAWKHILSKLLEEEIQKNPTQTIPIAQYLSQFSDKIELIKNDINNKSASIALQMMIRSMANYSPDKNLPELIEIQRGYQTSRNEFYSIFNIENNAFEWVSTNITNVIGLNSDMFSLGNLLGLENNKPLIHQEDIGHFMRWAGISYLLFSIPGFTFESNQDYQIIKFRFCTKDSKIQELRNLKYVLLSKKSQLHISPSSISSIGIPKYHFDTWSIFEPSYFDIVKPQFVTNFNQSLFMNNLAYLINAMIVDLPTKYLVIINERGQHDRNKAVANSINRNIQKYAHSTFEFDEYKIGDYINKSIKPKLTQIAKPWCPELEQDIQGDLEAVVYSRKLGLLNIPAQIERLIYENLDFA
jgi:hypothetical protein